MSCLYVVLICLVHMSLNLFIDLEQDGSLAFTYTAHGEEFFDFLEFTVNDERVHSTQVLICLAYMSCLYVLLICLASMSCLYVVLICLDYMSCSYDVLICRAYTS